MTRWICVLAVVVAGFLGVAPGALASGTWSAPTQVDHAGATVEGSYLLACPLTALCIGASGETGGPVAYSSSSGAVTAFAVGLAIPFGSGDNSASLTSLQCPTASLCVATADYNSDEQDDYDVLTSTLPAAGTSSWMHENVGDANTPTQLSCPTASFCAGPGGDGVVVSQDPTGGASAWTPIKLADPAELVDVDCPSADFCAAFDANGNVWTSSDPAGGSTAWAESGVAEPLAATAAASLGGGAGGSGAGPAGAAIGPEALSCSGPSLCVAIGTTGHVLVSTDPAAGGAWTSANIDSVPLTAVSCEPGTGLCLVGDNYGTVNISDDGAGASWADYSTPDAGGHAIDDISCVGQICSLATSDSQPPVQVTIPDESGPPAGIGAITGVVNHDALTSISCPSARECIGADASRYYASANPAKGVGSWKARVVENVPGNQGIGTLDTACYSASGCLAVTDEAAQGLADVAGGALYRFDPAGGAHRFSPVHLGDDNDILFATCAQGTCVAGYPGSWYQSARPALNTGWKHVRSPRFDVTCLQGNRSCVALAAGPFPGAAGHDLLVAPRRGGPWKSEAIDPTGYITGLACTSARACVVVDEGGALLVSTRPTSGVSSWRRSDSDPDGFNGVACENARTCVAVDDSGGVVVGRP